jgi:acid phosphatase family membrane protein YuiD
MFALTEFLVDLFTHRLLWVLVFTYVVTHGIKVLTSRYQKGHWSAEPLWATGGMPSSHASIVVALTVAIAFEEGASVLFFVTGIFALIIIRDSFGVRASVGEQAHLINVLSSKLNIHRKARIVLGHTPAQVVVGSLIGFAVAVGVYLLP